MLDHELWSTQQAADYLGVTRQAVHALARRGEVGRRVGRAWVFTKSEIDAWRDKPRPLGGRPPKANAGTLALASPA
ncbi:MAG TPA: helix-turn-helix domain-containing protein [Herpetosiphonaceae bacterium]|nr:helix-turn-helix domain-containing protein [Herpetosiphonaceae bacterium]